MTSRAKLIETYIGENMMKTSQNKRLTIALAPVIACDVSSAIPVEPQAVIERGKAAVDAVKEAQHKFSMYQPYVQNKDMFETIAEAGAEFAKTAEVEGVPYGSELWNRLFIAWLFRRTDVDGGIVE